MIAPATISSRFLETLFPPYEEGMASFAILDGASCRELVSRIDQHHPEQFCLYAGEMDEDVEMVAPYLVRLQEGHPFTSWLLGAIGSKPWGIFLRAPVTLRELRRHFRRFLIVKGPDGESLYFRYYDPRVFRAYLPSCEQSERDLIFGPVECYVIDPVQPAIYSANGRDVRIES